MRNWFTSSRRAAPALALAAAASLWLGIAPTNGAEQPDLIFKKSTVFKLLTPNDRLATYAIDDPEVDGVACHFTVPERGGVSGWLGIAEQVSDISLACRQVGPVRFKQKFAQGEEMFRSLMINEYGKSLEQRGGFGLAAQMKAQLLKHQEGVAQ